MSKSFERRRQETWIEFVVLAIRLLIDDLFGCRISKGSEENRGLFPDSEALASNHRSLISLGQQSELTFAYSESFCEEKVHFVSDAYWQSRVYCIAVRKCTEGRKRRRPSGGGFCRHKKSRKLLPYVPCTDPQRRIEQMASLATALTAVGVSFTDTLAYGLAPRSANCASFETGGMQVTCLAHAVSRHSVSPSRARWILLGFGRITEIRVKNFLAHVIARLDLVDAINMSQKVMVDSHKVEIASL